MGLDLAVALCDLLRLSSCGRMRVDCHLVLVGYSKWMIGTLELIPVDFSAEFSFQVLCSTGNRIQYLQNDVH